MKIVYLILALSWSQVSSAAEVSDNPWQEKPVVKKKLITPAEPSRRIASESLPSSNEVKLNLKTVHGCFVVSFKNPSGTLPACSELLPVSFTQRNCEKGDVEESGESSAMVDCTDSKRLSFRFKTSKYLVSVTSLVIREKEGRKGVGNRYVVQNESAEESSALMKVLPDAIIKPTVESKPEESPIKFKASGYMSVEYEALHGAGFAGINQLPNIPEAPSIAGKTDFGGFNLLSNINFDVSRDQTTLSAVLEIGEVYFGDSGTGGARSVPGTDQKTMKAMLELRNLFLTQEFTNRTNFQVGMMPISSDPKGFVYADQATAVKLNYKADLYDGYAYFAQGFRSDFPSVNSRPLTGYNKNEVVAGFSASGAYFDGLKSTLFGVFYRADNQSVTVGANSETAQMSSYFVGKTVEIGKQDELNAQFTAILNSNSTQAQTSSEQYLSYLLDAKLNFVWESARVNFSLEGLITPGATDGSLGNRKAFQSNTATHYIFNLVGSDGWDDAPGSARDYIVGKTSNQEGMRVLALTATSSVTKKLSADIRGGLIGTSAAHAVTGSQNFGNEYDFGTNYQVSPGVSLQFDFGEFVPGQYFGNHIAPAYLGASKLKFSF